MICLSAFSTSLVRCQALLSSTLCKEFYKERRGWLAWQEKRRLQIKRHFIVTQAREHAVHGVEVVRLLIRLSKYRRAAGRAGTPRHAPLLADGNAAFHPSARRDGTWKPPSIVKREGELTRW
jgi:hypothetical protein